MEMREHGIALERTVGATPGMGETRTGRRQRFEAEFLEVTRAADIPRIGNDEASGLVKLPKDFAFVRGRRSAHGTLIGIEEPRNDDCATIG
jgi:hypothetical protein